MTTPVLLLLRFPLAAAALMPAWAYAGTLYRCATQEGSLAYTSTKVGYRDCTVLSTYVDPPKPKPVAIVQRTPPKKSEVSEPSRTLRGRFAAVVAEVRSSAPMVLVATPMVAVASRAPVRTGWVYEENPARKANFSAIRADVLSSAPMVLVEKPMSAPRPLVATTASSPTNASVASADPTRPRIVQGAVYKVARKDGITEYTNIRPKAPGFAVLFTYIATCVACDVRSKIDFARTTLNLDAYKDEVAAAANEFGVDTALLRAVIHAESAFNPMALSNKGAQGLMQLMPGTADDLGVGNAFDAGENIRGGARYLSQLLRNFNGDTQLATAAYNAGPRAVQRYNGIPPYDETQVYVQRVATLRERYAKAM